MKIEKLSLKTLGLSPELEKIRSVVTFKCVGKDWTIDENLVLSYPLKIHKSEEDIKLILAHEMLHLYLLHPFIEAPKELELIHEATDYIVNDVLIYEFGLTRLLSTAKFKTDDKGFTPCGVYVRNKSFIELFTIMCKVRHKEVPTIVFKRKELNRFLKLIIG